MNCKCLCLNPGDHVHSKSPPKRSGDIPWVSETGSPGSAVPMRSRRSRLPLEALQGGTWSCHVLSAAFSEISCAVQLMFLLLVAARSMPGLLCQVWGEIGGNMMRCPSTVVTKAKPMVVNPIDPIGMIRYVLILFFLFDAWFLATCDSTLTSAWTGTSSWTTRNNHHNSYPRETRLGQEA